MPFQPVKFYQVGSFVAGNRLLDLDERTVQARSERSNTLTCGHRACQGCGSARRPLRARRRDARHRRPPGRRECDRAPRGLRRRPTPSRAGSRPGSTSLFGNARRATGRRGARQGTRGRARRRAGRRRRRRHRPGLSGMFERGDDVLYICYDNEAYMNTACSARAPRRRRPHGEHQAGRRHDRQRLRPG